MAEQTGVHDVIFHAEGRAYVSDHALELILPVLMPRERVPSMHATCTHAAGTGWATSAHLPRRISS